MTAATTNIEPTKPDAVIQAVLNRLATRAMGLPAQTSSASFVRQG